MKHYKLPFDSIWEPDKPVGIAYIDDKGINFKNNWGEITEKLTTKAKEFQGYFSRYCKKISFLLGKHINIFKQERLRAILH